MPTLVMSMANRVMIYLTTVHCKSKKHATCLMHNFGKCLLILKILTVGFCNKFAAKLCCISHCTLSMSLHYLAKLLIYTFDFQQVTDGDRRHVQVWENEPDIRQSWG